MRGRVKYFNAERGFGFIEADLDYYFNITGYRAQCWVTNCYRFVAASCPKITIGLQVEILDHHVNDKGPAATEWSIPSLHAIEPMFAVVRTSTSQSEYTADQTRRCYIAEKRIKESVVFVGSHKDCLSKATAGDDIRPVGA